MDLTNRNKGLRNALLAGTIISGVAFAAPAFAQSAGETVVVTGSRLVQKNLVATSPVTTIGGDAIDVAGVTRVEDMVTQLPQAFTSQNSTVSNGASGTAQVSLRGLGAGRTLVLIDGRRVPWGSPTSTPADLNQIPGQLVERVEVLTGGASAVYGSDAIAGVVNFIMRKNLNGVEINVQRGQFMHTNDYDGVGNIRNVIAGRAATNPAQFALPKDDVVDGRSLEITLAMGMDSPDEKGHMTAYVGYRNNAKVLQRDRDYSACAITGISGTNFACGGSSTSYPGRITDFGAFNKTIDTASGNTFRNFSSATDQYNYGPTNFYQRPDERYVLGAYGNYEINKHADVFTSLMFMDYSSRAQIAPSGVFGVPVRIPCNNPLLGPGMATTFGCTAADITAGTVIDNTGEANGATAYVLRRNVEGGPRQDDLRYQTFRAVIGVRGELAKGWSYDFAGQYSHVQLSRTYRNEFSIAKINRAFDVIPHPTTGVATCRSVVDGTDPNCVPYNMWRIGGVTAAALNYIQSVGVHSGSTSQQVVTLAVQGDLGESAGIQSPWAEEGVQIGFGIEYRRDSLVSEPDEAFKSGDLAGQGGPTIGLAGSVNTTDIFAEANIPLVSDKPFAKELGVDFAYRFSNTSHGGEITTYKVGGEWAPVEDVRFRASYQRAVGAPNGVQLFSTQSPGLTADFSTDPCSAAGALIVGSVLRNQCLATGVPVANLGNSTVLDSPAQQYQALFGGNPNLDVETSTTITYGFVLQPSFLSGFNMSVDYFDIEVLDLISTIGTANTLNGCYVLAQAAACSRVHRNQAGSLWTGTGYIEDLNNNIGGLQTSGFDFNANYRLDLESLGKLNFNLVGTLLSTYETDPGSGIPKYDCVGLY
ncbi:MAG: TonB-dependent receptor [Pseudomonadota bacterium]